MVCLMQDTIHMTTIYFMILGTTSGVVLSVVPQFAAILGALVIASVFLFRFYVRSSGTLKRLVGSADASLLAHVSESQQGIAVIQVRVVRSDLLQVCFFSKVFGIL